MYIASPLWNRSIEESESESFTMLQKIAWTACYLVTRTLSSRYDYYQMATTGHVDLHYLVKYSAMISNQQEKLLYFVIILRTGKGVNVRD